MQRAAAWKAILPAVIYFGILVPGDWTLLLLLLAAVASLPAFIYLILNRGPRSAWQILLLFIPIVAAVVALVRILQRSAPLLAFAIGCWVYPIILMSKSGPDRVIFAVVGGLGMWACLRFLPPFCYQPATTTLYVLALPMTAVVLITAIVMPLTGAFADVDSADIDVDDYGHSAGHAGAPQHSSGYEYAPAAYSSHLGSHDFATPFHDSPGAGSTHDAGFGPAIHQPLPTDHGLDVTDSGALPGPSQPVDATFDAHPGIHQGGDTTFHGVDWSSDHSVDVSHDADVGHVDAVSFDGISGDPTIHAAHGNISLNYSEASGNLVGHFADGGKIEVWGSPVTGNVYVDVGGETTRFHLNPTNGSWVNVDAHGVTRLDQDPITGDLRVHSPTGTTKFRFDPFTDRLIPG